MSARKRIEYVDVAKGIAILSVIVGHTFSAYDPGSLLNRFIYSFHMPLFIFLSGLLQKKWDARHPFRWDKPIYYIMIGYTLKFCIYGIKLLFHP